MKSEAVAQAFACVRAAQERREVSVVMLARAMRAHLFPTRSATVARTRKLPDELVIAFHNFWVTRPR
jgi:hypothetical protein